MPNDLAAETKPAFREACLKAHSLRRATQPAGQKNVSKGRVLSLGDTKEI